MSDKVLCFFLSLCLLCNIHATAATSEDEGTQDAALLVQDNERAGINTHSTAATIKDVLLPSQYNEQAGIVQCPVCDERMCITDLKCRDGEELREKQSVCGCCPGCVIVLNLGEQCSLTFGPKCREGLVCDPKTLVCSVMPGNNCLFYQNQNIPWKPTCLPDGSFAPRQCKGQKLTGRCFCYSPDGQKLFGAEWWSEAENMTCSCSRLGWQLQNVVGDKRTDVTLHCNQLGNFEELQCDNGLCWCADEKTGESITTIVPEHLMNVLPCYNATVIGSQYLRQCESKVIAQARIGIEMTEHGTVFRKSIKQNCDSDGSYGHYQIGDDNRATCSWKDGTTLGTYGMNVNAMQGMNCNCARDTKIYTDAGKDFNKICRGDGNYNIGQFDPSGLWYCVDGDGYATSEPMEINFPATIEGECEKIITVP